MGIYSLWYATDAGERITPMRDVSAFEYVKVDGDIGVASFTFPTRRPRTYHDHTPDRRVHIYRKGHLELIVFLRRFVWTTDAAGKASFAPQGWDLNELLSRRIVAEYAGSAEADWTDEADSIMKEIVGRALVDGQDYGGADTARDIDDHGFSVASDVAAGPSISKAFAWQNLLSALQGLQATSKSEGEEVFFAVVPTSETAMQFRTYTGQPGTDRTVAGNNPIIFSPERGNLKNARLEYDYSEERNFIYAGGQGQGTDRIIGEASDTARIGASIWNRREGFYQATSNAAAAGVQAAAKDELGRRRPTATLTGDVLNTPNSPYGKPGGWDMGDRVTVSYQDIQLDALIRAVHVKVDGRGQETVRARVEATL